MKEKYVQVAGNEATLGWKYDDSSQQPLLRLYNDAGGVFQIEFLNGSDMAYQFLPECEELLDILKEGIVGVSIKDMAQRLVDAGYIHTTSGQPAPRKRKTASYISIQNDAVKKYCIDLCDGSKCDDGDWSRTHAHPRIRRVCKWKQANSVHSTFFLFHEIGHIVNNNGKMRRAEQEYYATLWAIKEMAVYGLTVPEKILRKYQAYIDMEVDRGKRRGGESYASMKLPGI